MQLLVEECAYLGDVLYSRKYGISFMVVIFHLYESVNVVALQS